MGAHQSKPLEDLSTVEVSAFVQSLGKKGQYAGYAEAIDDNAVDGEVLASIVEEEEMKETMACLNITNFLHQKVLIKEWNKAKLVVKGKATKLERQQTHGTDAGSEITMDTSLSSAVPLSKSSYVRRVPDEPSTGVSSQPQQEEEDGVSRIPMRITVEHQQAIEPLHLPKDLELLPPESPELEPFRQIAGQACQDFQGFFAEVNLLDTTHMEDKPGLNNLAFIRPGQPPIRYHQEEEMELCRKFVLAHDEDFYTEDLPLGEFGTKEPARYYTHVVKLGDLRVGTVCVVLEQSSYAHTTEQQKQDILKFLASVTQQQFHRRRVLLERHQNLHSEIRHLKQAGVDAVLAPAHGPVAAVHASQVANRQSLFPYPHEDEEDSSAVVRNNGSPTQAQFSRRSAGLPHWHGSQQATPAQRSHIPGGYYNHPAFQSSGAWPPMDPTPVGPRDMERVALMNSLGLLQLDPLSPEAQTIQQLVQMTGVLLGADLALVSFLDHQHSFLFFPTTFPNAKEVSPKTHAWLDSHQLLQRHPTTGEPYVLRRDRCDSLCNFTIMSPHQQAFVVHDVARDQSVARFQLEAGVGFYSGAPIVLRGLTLGGLCILNREARPEFGRVQEQQQEQLAQMIAQQYESWALGREMRKLERERKLMLGNTEALPSLAKMRSNHPEGFAALVFTGVAGMEVLQKDHASIAKAALAMHDGIVFSKIADNGGYEVHNEDGSFHVAFNDVGNAVSFCLQTQEALQAAAWSEELLALPEACRDDAKCLKGLRVRMAVHCGDVELTTQPLSGRMAYTGETFHVAKALGSMAHGGQILVSADVWNVASVVTDKSLGSPQVLDLGSHVLPSQSKEMQDGITTAKVLQVVPKSLARDYRSQSSVGRTFPPIASKKAIDASFHEAPCEGGKISMVLLDTSELESSVEDPSFLLVALAKRIGSLLREEHKNGYPCQDFLAAFQDSSDAVRFGLAVQENLTKSKVLDVSLAGKLKIGVQEGLFESMGPNPVSGRAEYSGRVVKDVAFTAADAAPGSVYLGREPTEWDQFNMQPISNGFMLDFMARKYFEDIDDEFVLFKCHPCKSWYDQIIENRSGRRSLQTPWRNC